MELHKLTEDLSVASQLDAADVPLIAAKGFRSIVCNRPDGEAMGQPAFGPVEAAARAAGLAVAYQPVPSNAVSDADGAAFGKLLEELPKPVLAYCRSGTRCTILWALSQAPRQPLNEIVQRAKAAGYDLSRLEPRLKNLSTT
ncbi:MAG: TIGR01244 family sulfur transferase [Rhodomicrobium sp.]